MNKLKPCPFCGCDRVGMEVSAGGPAGRSASYSVRCHKCMSSCAGYGSYEIAAYHWNTRYESAKSAEQPVEYTVSTGQLVTLLTKEFEDLQPDSDDLEWKPIDYAIEAIRFLGKYKYEATERESVEDETNTWNRLQRILEALNLPEDSSAGKALDVIANLRGMGVGEKC